MTRPDHLSKVLNSIIRKESKDSQHFIYDRQAANDAYKLDQTNLGKQNGQVQLTNYDKSRLVQFDKSIDAYFQNYKNDPKGDGSVEVESPSGNSANQIDVSDNQQKLIMLGIGQNHLNTNHFYVKTDKDSKKQYTFSRFGVDQLLREFFNSVYLEDEIIKPRPIDVHLVKIGKIITNAKLFSNTVFIKMRPNIHILPLRCKSEDNRDNSKQFSTDRIDRIEKRLSNLTNQAEFIKLYDDIKKLETKTEHIAANWNQKINLALNDMNIKSNNFYKNLADMMSQSINTQNDNLYRNLSNKFRSGQYTIMYIHTTCYRPQNMLFNACRCLRVKLITLALPLISCVSLQFLLIN